MEWQPSACILCSINCGIEIALGGEDQRQFQKIRGDKNHPSSQGYLCQKATRLNHYQNGKDRLTSPMRRNAGGEFEPVSWDTAITEIAARLGDICQEHGGDKVFYYGGGGQGNHLPGQYAAATLASIGSVYRSNALAQEKTGEFWVQGKMFGAPIHPCFEDCDLAFFLGKNPWQSHGFPRARNVLNEIHKDPDRHMIVVDPVCTETADKADIHLQLKPGSDVWLMSALAGLLVQRGWHKAQWLEEHVIGQDVLVEHFQSVPVEDYCRTAGISLEQLEQTAVLIRDSKRIAFMEDLGIQMNRHSTLVSYMNRVMWLLTGSFAKPGSMNVFNPLHPLVIQTGRPPKASPVKQAKIIYGLVPCNVIPEEILTDHPNRYRAMIVESANPAHSLADSDAWRRALDQLDLVVVVDVAMTETARHADYVLPTANQFEKWECSFFNLDPIENVFHLRKPVLSPPTGVLTEAEIHSRLVEALGAVPQTLVDELKDTLKTSGLPAFAQRLWSETQTNPRLKGVLSVILYRTLGQTLAEGQEAAPLWVIAHSFAQRHPDALARAGFSGSEQEMGEKLFRSMLTAHSGVVFSVDDPETSWDRVGVRGQKINGCLPELMEILKDLPSQADIHDTDYPYILSAGERRSFTANTIYRDPEWRKKDREGCLRMSGQDAQELRVNTGDRVKVITKAGSGTVRVEVSTRMQPGHVSLPNGYGLSHFDQSDDDVIAPNELTRLKDRDPFAGTPWHKSVAARIEPLA